MKSCRTLKGGLQDVADDLNVHRVGQMHQAGSDAMLTGSAFFKMRSVSCMQHDSTAPWCALFVHLQHCLWNKCGRAARRGLSVKAGGGLSMISGSKESSRSALHAWPLTHN